MTTKKIIQQLKYWLKKRNDLTLTDKQIQQIQGKKEMLKILKEDIETVEFEWSLSISLCIFDITEDAVVSYVSNNYNELFLDNGIDEIKWSPNWQTI